MLTDAKSSPEHSKKFGVAKTELGVVSLTGQVLVRAGCGGLGLLLGGLLQEASRRVMRSTH